MLFGVLYMSKKSVTLPAHVLKVVEEEVKKNYSGSFKNYVLELIRRDKQGEIDKAYDEMPVKVSKAIKAGMETNCLYCGKKMHIGNRICNAQFKDGHQQYVHEKCCRD